jgi:hypothetical protein
MPASDAWRNGNCVTVIVLVVDFSAQALDVKNVFSSEQLTPLHHELKCLWR